MDPTLPAVFSQQFNMPQASSGMFGGGQSWRNALLAAIAGFMARRSPGVSGNIINGLQDAQTMRERLAFAEQQHRQEFDDARLAHQQDRQFDINNPMPNQPTQTDRYISEILDPNTDPKRRELLQSVVIPPLMEMVNGNLMAVPRTMSSAPPVAPVGKLTPLGAGGPTPQASGGFPY
jgi:hypothetical protein